MLFFRKKHGFKSNNNIFKRLYLRYSGLLPLIAAFTLGVFGTSVYYKNQPAKIAISEGLEPTKLDSIIRQLNNEKDITDSLSGKNIELKEELKKALSKADNQKDVDAKVTDLNNELTLKKEENQKLIDENSRLKVRINNTLAEVKTLKEEAVTASKEEKGRGNRNTVQNDITQKTINDATFNKVKMISSEDDLKENKSDSSTNRNNVLKVSEVKVNIPKKVINKKRTMKLKKGESLWNLSKRAYGKGIYYKKIIKANPSITEKSFKKLRPGTRINVPL